MQTVKVAPPRVSYRVSDAASVIGVSRRTVERWIAGGTLRAHKVGRTVLIPAADVHALTAGAA